MGVMVEGDVPARTRRRGAILMVVGGGYLGWCCSSNGGNGDGTRLDTVNWSNVPWLCMIILGVDEPSDPLYNTRSSNWVE